jgi:hypothetical protein
MKISNNKIISISFLLKIKLKKKLKKTGFKKSSLQAAKLQNKRVIKYIVE